MTQPPHGPGPWQGQQPGHQPQHQHPYGQQGGYAGPPGSPGASPYGPGQPYPSGQSHPGYPGSGGPGGPHRSKIGLWIALGVGVLVVAALLFTGFVAPGFFVGDDDNDGNSGSADNTGNSADQGPNGAPNNPPPDLGGVVVGNADEFAAMLVGAVSNRDQAALETLKCTDARPTVNSVISLINNVQTAQLNGPLNKVPRGELYYAPVLVNLNNGKVQAYEAEIAKAGEKWCWKGAQTSNRSRPNSTGASPTTTPTG